MVISMVTAMVELRKLTKVLWPISPAPATERVLQTKGILVNVSVFGRFSSYKFGQNRAKACKIVQKRAKRRQKRRVFYDSIHLKPCQVRIVSSCNRRSLLPKER